MIKPREIQNKAREVGVRDQQIEKDYILSWILQGISQHGNLAKSIVFKGGTVLKKVYFNFYISYIGPLGGQGNNKKVKIDISRSEKLAFDTVKRDVIISYSDQEEHQLLSYSLEEVLVEKLRSVMQRMQARDFYDIWYLLEIHGMDIGFFVNEFRTKCENKDLKPTDFHHKLEQRLPQYKGRWRKTMADQIRNLPDFEQVEREVMRHLKKFEL